MIKGQYRKGSLFDGIRDARESGFWDCDDYAWSSLLEAAGGYVGAIVALVTFRAGFHWVWGEGTQSWWPRHTVLCYRGRFIDSTDRQWRGHLGHKAVLPFATPWPWVLARVIWGATIGRVFG